MRRKVSVAFKTLDEQLFTGWKLQPLYDMGKKTNRVTLTLAPNGGYSPYGEENKIDLTSEDAGFVQKTPPGGEWSDLSCSDL